MHNHSLVRTQKAAPHSSTVRRKKMKYVKYHALGNDYMVISPTDLEGPLNTRDIQLVCHRNYGVGSDGILLGPLNSHTCDFGLRIFNPDGSEAEKSGNGLRIFSRFLWDQGKVGKDPFTVETLGLAGHFPYFTAVYLIIALLFTGCFAIL